MYKDIVYSTKEAPDKTGYNYPPKNLREITEADFARSHFFVYMPDAIETRSICYNFDQIQLLDPDEKCRLIQITIFWLYDGTCLGIENDHRAGRIRYYQGGCKHEYRELSRKECKERGIYRFGWCWHVQECKLCGHVWSYDSSD